jgi:hypothetical protein
MEQTTHLRSPSYAQYGYGSQYRSIVTPCYGQAVGPLSREALLHNENSGVVPLRDREALLNLRVGIAYHAQCIAEMHLQDNVLRYRQVDLRLT